MIDALPVTLTGLATGLTALSVIQLREGAPRPPVSHELHFPSDLSEDAVKAALAAVSGLGRGSWVTLDLLATPEGISHRLSAAPPTLDTLTAQLRGILPGLRSTPSESSPDSWTHGATLRWSGSHLLLRDDQGEESIAALLGALMPLRRGEAVLLHWTLRPTRGPRVAPPPSRSRSDSTGPFHFLGSGPTAARDDRRPLRTKYAAPLILGKAVVAVRTTDDHRAAHLLGRLVANFRSRRGAAGWLRARRVRGPRLQRLLSRPPRRGNVYTPAELVGLLGWPIGAPRVSGLTLGTAPQLLPSSRIPTRGRVLVRSTWPGQVRPMAQPITGALSHTLIVGPTGVGKSVLLANLILQDLQAGRGCLVLDGKGDLADDLLARIPEKRIDDVIVLDPAAAGPVPGVRVFGGGNDSELTADLILGVFRDLFAGSWGPRTEQWLRAGLVTLAIEPGMTLADLPLLFTSDAFRRRLIGRLGDPLLRATWAGFEAMSPAERVHQLAAPLNKLDQVIGRKRVRAILAQPAPKLDMDGVLRQGKVVIVSLAPGRIGTPAARLIGALTIYQLFAAVQGRAALPPEARRPFLAYLDEPKVLGDVPVPLDSLFELARGFGVGLTLAAQSVSQLPKHLQRALLTNAGTLMAFRQTADDARLLARELPPVTPEELQHLPAFELVARIGLGPGDVAPVATGSTTPLPTPSSDPAAIREASAARYGVEPETVDAALRARHEPEMNDGPVGRRRRNS